MQDQGSTPTAQKHCAKCGEMQALDGFSRDKTRHDGLSPYCKQCRKAYGRTYYEGHREQINAQSARWRAEHLDRAREAARDRARERYAGNPEKYKVANRASKARHRDKRLEETRQWRAENPDAIRSYSARYWREKREYNTARYRAWARQGGAVILQRRRSALKHGVETKAFTLTDWQDRVTGFNGHCAYCLKPMAKVTMDHMDPISRGGVHAIENLVPACAPCNTSKSNRTLLEMLVLQQRLEKARHRSPRNARRTTAAGPASAH